MEVPIKCVGKLVQFLQLSEPLQETVISMERTLWATVKYKVITKQKKKKDVGRNIQGRKEWNNIFKKIKEKTSVKTNIQSNCISRL